MFKKSNAEVLQIALSLKKSGMSISDTLEFIGRIKQEKSTRPAFFQHQRKSVPRQIKDLKKTSAVLEFKCRFDPQAEVL